MVKSYKKVAKVSLAALVATSAIVPVATASAASAENVSVGEVIFEIEGKLVKFKLSDYINGITDGNYDQTQFPKYVITSDNKVYLVSDYINALTDTLNEDGTANTELIFSSLESQNTAKDVDVTQIPVGSFEDGKVVGGQTPEENSIETFFYNLAA